MTLGIIWGVVWIAHRHHVHDRSVKTSCCSSESPCRLRVPVLAGYGDTRVHSPVSRAGSGQRGLLDDEQYGWY